jgi:hypothetical protein
MEDWCVPTLHTAVTLLTLDVGVSPIDHIAQGGVQLLLCWGANKLLEGPSAHLESSMPSAEKAVLSDINGYALKNRMNRHIS